MISPKDSLLCNLAPCLFKYPALNYVRFVGLELRQVDRKYLREGMEDYHDRPRDPIVCSQIEEVNPLGRLGAEEQELV